MGEDDGGPEPPVLGIGVVDAKSIVINQNVLSTTESKRKATHSSFPTPPRLDAVRP